MLFKRQCRIYSVKVNVTSSTEDDLVDIPLLMCYFYHIRFDDLYVMFFQPIDLICIKICLTPCQDRHIIRQVMDKRRDVECPLTIGHDRGLFTPIFISMAIRTMDNRDSPTFLKACYIRHDIFDSGSKKQLLCAEGLSTLRAYFIACIGPLAIYRQTV